MCIVSNVPVTVCAGSKLTGFMLIFHFYTTNKYQKFSGVFKGYSDREHWPEMSYKTGNQNTNVLWSIYPRMREVILPPLFENLRTSVMFNALPNDTWPCLETVHLWLYANTSLVLDPSMIPWWGCKLAIHMLYNPDGNSLSKINKHHDFIKDDKILENLVSYLKVYI